MIFTRKSTNYLRIFMVIIPFVWGCNTDMPLPSEETKRIDKGWKIVEEKAEENYIDEYVKNLFDHPGYYYPSSLSNLPPTADNARVNNYTVEVRKKKDDEKTCIDYFRLGRKIRSDCADSSNRFVIVTRPVPGTDINGDGLSELIVENYSGGYHCCFNYAIFSLGKNLKIIDVLRGEHSYFDFKDLDGDGKYEAIGRDWTFAYWSSSFAGSPAPEVILRWKNGKYRLAEDLMKKPPPEEKDLYKMPSGFEEGETFTVVSSIMLKLIYTGNGNLALQYCEWFWQNLDKEIPKQERLNHKKEFLAEFKKQLKKSHYWVDLKKMNGW